MENICAPFLLLLLLAAPVCNKTLQFVFGNGIGNGELEFLLPGNLRSRTFGGSCGIIIYCGSSGFAVQVFLCAAAVYSPLHSGTEVLSLFANKYMVATIYFFKGLLSCDKMSNI